MQPGAYDVHPYVLMNLSENYDGLSTYAHEWGHAMHTLLANSAQPYELASYPTFTAEVASTTHDVLMANTLAERAKPRRTSCSTSARSWRITAGLSSPGNVRGIPAGHQRPRQQGEALSGEKMSASISTCEALSRPKVMIEPVTAPRDVHPALLSSASTCGSMRLDHRANFFAQKVMMGRQRTGTLSRGSPRSGSIMDTTCSNRAGSIWHSRALSSIIASSQGPRPGRSELPKRRPSGPPFCLTIILALRELEAAAGLGAAVLLALDDARGRE